MITHTYGGKGFKSLSVRKFNGLEGWFVIGKSTGTDGFHVIAKTDHGIGFASRDKARVAMKHVKAAGYVNCL